jgi:DNA-binding MarR family transcriptional regulator
VVGTLPVDVTQVDVSLADHLIDAVGVLRRQVRRSAGRPWPVGTLTTAHGELIRVIRRQPGISIAEAAFELGLAANTVSTLVAQLTGRQLVVRTPDPDDRRVGRLTLTSPARQQVEDWRDRRAAVAAGAISHLTQPEREALRAALPALARMGELLRPEPR